jgi:hypothetical protein
MIDGRTGRCGCPVLFLEYLCIGDEKAAGDIFSRKLFLTFWYDKYIVCVAVNFIKDSLLFRVVEIQRICEATATPENPGRCQPERAIEQ